MLGLEVLCQRFLSVLGEAGTEAADEQLTESLQAFVVLGLAVGVQGHDLAERLSAKATLEWLLLVGVLVKVVQVMVRRQRAEFLGLDGTKLALEEVDSRAWLGGCVHLKSTSRR